jgi:hypothetical protein
MDFPPVTESEVIPESLMDPNWAEVRLKWKQERPMWFYEEEWQVYLMAVEPSK